MKYILLLAAAVVSFTIAAVNAAEIGNGAAIEKIATTLRARYPDVKFKQIAPAAQLPGFYEIVSPSGIVYTDAKADILIVGTLFDTRTQTNLTEQRWAELQRIDFNILPLDKAIKTVKGNGQRRLAVFSDPDCPYCKKLEEEGLKDLTDVTIYTFPYPLPELHPDAPRKARAIWCAEDRSAAWSNWMLKGILPETSECKEDSLSQVEALGRELGVNSTPTLFLGDGRRIQGAVSLEQLDFSLVESAVLTPKTP